MDVVAVAGAEGVDPAATRAVVEAAGPAGGVGHEALGLSFVEEHHAVTPDEPLFLYVAHVAPHWPLHALPEDIARYEERYRAGWDVLRELNPRLVMVRVSGYSAYFDDLSPAMKEEIIARTEQEEA